MNEVSTSKTDTTATTGYAPVNGAQLYYEMAGSGEPMLLLHAGVADGRMWDAQFPFFARHFRTIRFDLRGFGRSVLPGGRFAHHRDVLGLLDYLDAPQASLTAVSFGGLVALDVALAAPERVRALVLGAPSISGQPPSARVRDFWAAEDAAYERGDLHEATKLNVRLWVDGIYRTPDQVDTAVRQRVYDMQYHLFTLPEPEDAEAEKLEPPAYGRLPQISQPALVLVGGLDLPEKVEGAARLAATLPNAQHAIIPGVAHMLNMEAPDTFNQLALAFLQTHVI
ncbi:MAG: alpha/beta fold hydrolase [Ardenticatenaceae bacterium]|nr:alpha/beta fold hydrolase [Ardenticatenaceae bacterium]